MKLATILVLAAACHKPSANCERAVKHVVTLTLVAGTKPKADEQAAIDQIEKGTMDQCDSEGLSDAQRDCILAARSLDDRTFLMCPALVAKPPSWIFAPIGHPEVIEEIKKQP